jgi:hypothetical protein
MTGETPVLLEEFSEPQQKVVFMTCSIPRLICLTLIAMCITLIPVGTQAASPAQGLTIIEQGKPLAIIVTPANRNWQGQSWQMLAEQHAALALQANLLDMTGAKLPIVSEKDLGQVQLDHDQFSADGKAAADVHNFIFVGLGQVAADTFKLNVDGLLPGGMRIITRGNCLLMIASPALSHPITDGGGIRHAVTTLLENLGFAYLWPGQTGKVTPHADTVTLQDMDITWKPEILQRNIRWAMESSRYMDALKGIGLDPQQCKANLEKATRTRAADLVTLPQYQSTADFTWFQWQGLGGTVGINGGHAFGDAWDKWGKDHPEWFALQPDGTRDQSKAGGRSRLCVSNPGLINAVADQIIAQANEHPEQKSFSLCPNDGGYSSFCTCPVCEALDPANAPKVTMLLFDHVGESPRHAIQHASLTDRYVWFWNRVAQRVNKVHPDLLFIVDAYSYYQAPPVREHLDPHLVLRYVPSSTDGWDGWKNMGAKRMYWRPNILLRGLKQSELCLYADTLAASIHKLNNDGMFAMDMDSIVGSWSIVGLNDYVAARVMVEPSRSFEDVLNEYCQKGFGPAAPAVHDYFTHAIKMYHDNGVNVVPVKTLATLREDLSRADELASGPDLEPVRARINFLRIGLNMSELHQRIDDLTEQAKAGKPVDLDHANALFDLYLLACRDLAMNHPVAFNVGYTVLYSGHFAPWRPLKVTQRQPSKETLALIEKEHRSMTGHENSMEDLFNVYGLESK